MVDIQSVAAEIRRGKKEEKEEDRKKLQGKNIMAPLLRSAAIITAVDLVVSVAFYSLMTATLTVRIRTPVVIWKAELTFIHNW